MKKLCVLLLFLGLLLAGCGNSQAMETVLDGLDTQVMAPARKVNVTLPEEASVPSMEDPQAGSLYLCDGYEVTVQTLNGGDLNETIYNISGYQKQQLTVMQTRGKGFTKYQCAWSTTEEQGDMICRSVILDDGAYHYAVTVMVQADTAAESSDSWQGVLDSVALTDIG